MIRTASSMARALSIGMVLAHEFSARLGLCAQEEPSRVAAHLAEVGLPTRLAQVPGGVGTADGAHGRHHAGQEGQARQAHLHPDPRASARASSPTMSTPRPCGPSCRTSYPNLTTMTASDHMRLSAVMVFLLLAAGFFFAGSETALTAASRARLLALERGGNRDARIVNKVLETARGDDRLAARRHQHRQHRRRLADHRHPARLVRRCRHRLCHGRRSPSCRSSSPRCCPRPSRSTIPERFALVVGRAGAFRRPRADADHRRPDLAGPADAARRRAEDRRIARRCSRRRRSCAARSTSCTRRARSRRPTATCSAASST